MQNVYKNIEEYNISQKRKIVFDDMIADMTNKKLNSVVTKLFIRGRKINISIVFIRKSYFKVPKENSTLFLSWKFQIKEKFNKLH